MHRSLLQWLTIAYANHISASLALLHLIAAIHPMDVAWLNLECLAVESWVAVALANVDDIILDVGGDDEERLLAAANAQALALAYGVEVRTLVCAYLLAIAHREAIGLAKCLIVLLVARPYEAWRVG